MIQLNSDQQHAVDKLVEHVRNPVASYLTVKGGGGVGKSTSVFTAIRELIEVEKLDVLLCAPTHKALNVLRAMSEQQGVDVQFATLASALGLRALPEEGQLKFVQGDSSKIGDYDVIIIDECSQIGEKSLRLLLKECQKFNTILMMMGDNCQLFPVKSYESPVFASGDSVTLTKVMRYSGDILHLATEMRKIIVPEDYGLSPELAKSKINLASMVAELFPNGSDTITVLPAAELVYASLPHTDPDNVDAVSIVCWTNDQADAYNNTVHQHLYGHMVNYDPNTYYVGDILLPQDPVLRGQAVLFPIDAELVVKSVSQHQYDLLDRNMVLIDYFQVDVQSASDGGSSKVINVVAPHHVALYNQAISEIAAMCKRRELYWSSFWDIKNKFTAVKRPFARTSHKAQGSTYPHTFVDAHNIAKCHQVALHNRMLYTAITRAAKHLTIGV